MILANNCKYYLFVISSRKKRLIMNRIIIDTPIGKLELIEKMNKLARISFEEDFNSNIEYKETIFLKDCYKQLKEYFNV